jgi:hypothetical protein
MSIIPYPRVGQRLAPNLLREILDVPVGNAAKLKLPIVHHMRLCDLNESVWTRFSSEVCIRLAEEVVHEVGRSWPVIETDDRALPKASFDFSLELLPLEVRTFNCLDYLRGKNPLVHPEEWGRLTLDDLFELKAFGAKSLVDFLCSYESFVDQKAGIFLHELLEGSEVALHSWINNDISFVPPEYLPVRLPSIPEGITFDSLGLRYRTHRILEEQGYAEKPTRLSERTMQELLSLRGFGVTCLKDLLAALFRLRSDANAREHFLSKPVGRATTADDVDQTNLLRHWLKNPVFPLPRQVLRSNLPSPPPGATAYSLELQSRTINCLVKHGYADHLASLTELTIRGLLKLQGFGEEAVKDLLTAWFRIPALNPPIKPLLASSIEEELRGVIEAANSGSKTRNAALVVQYFGFDGKKSLSLREVGDIGGITKERVRQICCTTARKIKAREPATPLLDKAIKQVAQMLPRRAEEIEMELHKQGFSKEPYRVESLIEAARLMGRSVPFVVIELDGCRMALFASQVSHFQQVAKLARELTRTWGVATINDLAARVAETIGSAITSEFVGRVLSGLAGFSWLDESSGWFWLKGNSRNRLLTPIRKILAVAGRIELASLREGVGRHYLMQGFAPPRRVLLELCRQLPEFRVENTVVIADPPIDWQEELEAVERTMTRILKENGSVMKRARFEELCVREHMNRSTFYVYLGYSPIIERLTEGVYGLRGAEIQPGIVESLKPARSRDTTVRLDHGWTADGRVWVAYRLSQSMLTSGVCSVPSGFKQHLHGSFALVSSDGTQIGRFTVGDNSGWGLVSLFNRRGGEPGDILLLEFDLSSRCVSAKIGGDELISPEPSVITA